MLFTRNLVVFIFEKTTRVFVLASHFVSANSHGKFDRPFKLFVVFHLSGQKMKASDENKTCAA